MIELRPRQLQALADLRQAYASGARAPILVAPTGFGKTATAVEIVRAAVAKGRRVWFLAHLEEILDDTTERLLAAGINFGQIRSGRSVDYSSPVQVVMVQTAVSKQQLPWPDLIIIDECHLAVADSYVKVINAVGRPLMMGLTGTPQRLDNRGLIEVFDRLVLTCSTFELMQEGLLAKVRLFNPGTAGALSGKGSVAVGDALSHWKRECEGRRGVAFCMSIAHAEAIADQWNRASYRAMAVHGRSSKEDRKRAIRGLRSGQLDLVACAKLWIAGVDVPEIDAVLWLRKTSSLVDWLQGCGRGMRIAPGKKDLIILDHVGNSSPNRLDHPLIEREWSLHGHAKKKGDAAPSVKVCPKCFSAMPSAARECPDCGHEFVAERRELQHVDGELEEVQQVDRKREQASAQTLDELIAIGRRRNMKNPAGWARHVMAARSLRSGKARVRELVS
jgi:superfamily II DNA or RNA helicase